MIRLIRNSAEPLHQQLYRQIRDELVSGSFSNNSSRLPSSRALATDLGISRLTVNLALEKLHAEGYLRTRIGSGTFVADSLPETFLSSRRPKTQLLIERPPRLSNRVKNIPDKRAGKQFDFGIAGPPGVSFVPALPGARRIPHRNLGTTASTSARQKGSAFAAIRIEPRRPRPAQSDRNLLVRLQRRALSPGPDHYHRWNAAGDDDQRHGAGESG